MTDEKPPSGKSITARPQRVMLPPSDYIGGYLLEIFELGGRPGKRHAVWLHQLKAGGYRWKCSCGAQRSQPMLDVALLVDARTHFDQAWDPAPVPVGNFACIWNDRARQAPPPSTEDLERLALDLFGPPDELALRRNRGKLSPGVEVVHLCGLCGQTFEIKPDDPHWVTGRGPICPPHTKEPA